MKKLFLALVVVGMVGCGGSGGGSNEPSTPPPEVEPTPPEICEGCEIDNGLPEAPELPPVLPCDDCEVGYPLPPVEPCDDCEVDNELPENPYITEGKVCGGSTTAVEVETVYAFYANGRLQNKCFTGDGQKSYFYVDSDENTRLVKHIGYEQYIFDEDSINGVGYSTKRIVSYNASEQIIAVYEDVFEGWEMYIPAGSTWDHYIVSPDGNEWIHVGQGEPVSEPLAHYRAETAKDKMRSQFTPDE